MTTPNSEPPSPSVTQSPMLNHDLCYNTDVLANIFALLGVSNTMDQSEILLARKTLLAAAKSCKAFKEVALDALWRVLPSLLPLLRLFPSFIRLDGVYILNGIGEKDWNLYDSYARRVREVVFLATSHPRVSPFVCFQMARMRPLSAGLFVPLLKAIHLTSGTNIEPSLILALPGPQTETVVFDDNKGNFTDQFMQAFIETLSHSPNLTSLTLASPKNVALILLPKLSQLRHLALRMPLPSQPILRFLGGLSHLTDLVLHTSYSSPPGVSINNGEGSAGYPNTLASLHRFKLVGHPSAIARMLDDVLPINIQHFVIQEEETSIKSPTSSSWQHIFSRLSILQHLQSIQINQCSERTWGNPGYALSMDLITPGLIKLPNPAQFHSFIINNGAMHATTSVEIFFSVFQHIRVFKLPLTPYKSYIKFLSIIPLIISLCPNLETLQLPSWEEDAGESLSFIRDQLSLVPAQKPHSLKELFLNDSLAVQVAKTRMEDLVLYAEVFDLAFPELRSLVNPDGANKGWAVVESMTLGFQRARRRHMVSTD